MKKVFILFELSIFIGTILSSCNNNENKAKKAIAAYVKSQEEANSSCKILEYGQLEEAPYSFTSSDVYKNLQEKRTGLRKEIKEKSGYKSLLWKPFKSDAEQKEMKRIEEELKKVDSEIDLEIEAAKAVWVSPKRYKMQCRCEISLLGEKETFVEEFYIDSTFSRVWIPRDEEEILDFTSMLNSIFE